MSTFESLALEANLKRTAAEVDIPEQYNVLLNSVSDWYGVHKRLEDLLLELNHPYVNWNYVIDNLKFFSISDFEKFNSSSLAEEAIEKIYDIYFFAMSSTKDLELKIKALRSLFEFTKVVLERDSKNSTKRFNCVNRVFERLEKMDVDNLIFVKSSYHVKSLITDHLSPLKKNVEKFWSFAVSSFVATSEYWLSCEDPSMWFEKGSEAGLTDEIDVKFEGERKKILQGLVEPISHKSLNHYLSQISNFRDKSTLDKDEVAALISGLPDDRQILNAYLLVAQNIDNKVEFESCHYLIRIDYLFNILGSKALSEIHVESLRQISMLLSDGFAEEPVGRRGEFVQKIYRVLRRLARVRQFKGIVLDCVLTMAQNVNKTNDDDLYLLMIDETIKLGFEHPNVSETNIEWQIQVNPEHIKNIRVWLKIIALRPLLSKKLLSTLIVNLKLGGIVIRDTDLFQRDISEFLNSDLKEIFNIAKQLLSIFPAFFNEIGAEGEIRDVSTRADELSSRNDVLIHFIRKQSHVESNNLLVKFIGDSFRYFATADKSIIKKYLPGEIFESIKNEGEYFDYLAQIFKHLFDKLGDNLENWLVCEPEALQELIGASESVNERDKERAFCLVRMFQLLSKKYNPLAFELVNDLNKSSKLDQEKVALLEQSLNANDNSAALSVTLELMDSLKKTILSDKITEPDESIYYKRHIAAGIPSMYGIYREEKFDAAGLYFKLESLGKALLDKIVEKLQFNFLTKSTIINIYEILPLFLKAFELEGIPNRQLASKINYLKIGFGVKLFSIDQYHDVFMTISRSIQNIVKNYYVDLYKNRVENVVEQMIDEGHYINENDSKDRQKIIIKHSEKLFRAIVSSAFGLQTFDNLITNILNILTSEVNLFKNKKAILNLAVTYNPDLTLTSIHETRPELDNSIVCGNKGFWLKRMASFGINVPAGFILTTEIFRCFDAILSYKTMLKDLNTRVLKGVEEIEKATGKRLGDPDNPLLLSVRSGAAISMPGMMDTFLNVGLNKHICEKVSRNIEFDWALWDSYRRFLQMWGMNSGLERSLFDKIIGSFKTKYKIDRKMQFTPRQMKEIALAYRKEIQSCGIRLFDNPVDQLKHAIIKCFQSWNSECATIYRKHMNLSDDWGTAVIVQSMVFGNMNYQAGSGVTFTRCPKGQNTDLQLFGDFSYGIQGDDIVSGLIMTYPISETQRKQESRSEISLENTFPEIFAKLMQNAELLIKKKGFDHQEIEFTFEGNKPENLYLLQTRDQYQEVKQQTSVAFKKTKEMADSYLGTGVGVGDGLVSGIAVFNEKDIKKFKKLDSKAQLILVRRDTVPEDVGLLLQVDAILTSRGGRTSHAAVTIPQLRKIGVVGFSQMEVFDEKHYCLVGSKKIHAGDFVSMNGYTGELYAGKQEIVALSHPKQLHQ